MNPTEVNSIPIPDEELRALWAEWDALAAGHPTPTHDDMRPDYVWMFDHITDGSIDPNDEYWGLYVAVYQQRLVGAGPDPFVLQVRLARELNVHPARIVTTLRGGESF